MLLGGAALACATPGGGAGGAHPGAVAAAPHDAGGGAPAAGIEIAVTIDDLPFAGGLAPGDSVERATERILSALAARGAPAAGFVVCEARGDLAPLERWMRAGVVLGNHSSTHRHLDDLDATAWEADVARCKARLEGVTGAPVRWFRHPFLQSGKTVERRDEAAAILRRLGHEVAPVSIDTQEWVLVAPYLAALAAGDRARAEAVGRAWVDHVLAAFRRYVAVARARDLAAVRHVLLLHANALAADQLPALLEALAAAGARFVTLERALADPVYARADGYAGGWGVSWLYRFAPALTGAWAWDDGQQEALARRFGVRADRTPVRIATDLVVRPLAPSAWTVVHEEPYPATSFVAEMEDGTLLLADTPYTPEATATVLEWLHARFGARPRVAVHTHFHDDRVGGIAALAAAGIPSYGSDLTARLVAERGRSARDALIATLDAKPALAAAFRAAPLRSPDRLFPLAEGLTLRFGARDEARLIHPGPGHSPDNVVLFLPRHRILHGGCLVLSAGRDRPGYVADADLARWPDAVRALLPLPVDHVIPGHGEPGGRELLEHTIRVLEAAASR